MTDQELREKIACIDFCWLTCGGIADICKKQSMCAAFGNRHDESRSHITLNYRKADQIIALIKETGYYDRLVIGAVFEEVPPLQIGKLEVTGIPRMAVYVDVIGVGFTPLRVDLSPGNHGVTIQDVPIEIRKTTRITVA